MNFCETCGTGARDCGCGALTPDTTLRRVEAMEASPRLVAMYARYDAARRAGEAMERAREAEAETRRLAGLRALAERDAGA